MATTKPSPAAANDGRRSIQSIEVGVPLLSALVDAGKPLTLRDLVIARAMAEIRYIVQQEKRRRGELGFDDMLCRLDDALHQPGGFDGEAPQSQRQQAAPDDQPGFFHRCRNRP